ncbi:MAG: hypothetical protein RL559_1016 [Pseudomonadota bacterium]|jgi:hypothetical protein
MDTPAERPTDTQHAVMHLSDVYRRAAEELLHAYQRNKEATRHHERGAFRAALHHAQQSCRHARAAHEHLRCALEQSQHLAASPALSEGVVLPLATHRQNH